MTILALQARISSIVSTVMAARNLTLAADPSGSICNWCIWIPLLASLCAVLDASEAAEEFVRLILNEKWAARRTTLTSLAVVVNLQGDAAAKLRMLSILCMVMA